jgi:Fur family ferric uptake transcriptional regulator
MRTRRTRSQDRIFNLLKSLGQEISAQNLYVQLRSQGQGLGLATVYRSLEALKLEGSIQVRTLPSGESLYSCVREDRHHFTCLQCGDSVAIDKNACPVHELEMELNQSHRFKIYYHMLEFFGLCTQCQTSNSMEDSTA